jgi:hypothetical protein
VIHIHCVVCTVLPQLQAVLDTLSTLYGFGNASQVLLAGTSAGGIGAGLYSSLVCASVYVSSMQVQRVY